MKCINCKKEIEEDSNFCIHCGFNINVVDENTTDVKKEMEEFLEFMGKIEEFDKIYHAPIMGMVGYCTFCNNESEKEEIIKSIVKDYKSWCYDISQLEPPKVAKKGFKHYLNSIKKELSAQQALLNTICENHIKYTNESSTESKKAFNEFKKISERYYKISLKLAKNSNFFVNISKKLCQLVKDYS